MKTKIKKYKKLNWINTEKNWLIQNVFINEYVKITYDSEGNTKLKREWPRLVFNGLGMTPTYVHEILAGDNEIRKIIETPNPTNMEANLNIEGIKTSERFTKSAMELIKNLNFNI